MLAPGWRLLRPPRFNAGGPRGGRGGGGGGRGGGGGGGDGRGGGWGGGGVRGQQAEARGCADDTVPWVPLLAAASSPSSGKFRYSAVAAASSPVFWQLPR